MPELPEVETIVRGIRGLLQGRSIRTVIQARDGFVRCELGDFSAGIEGRRIATVRRRGKWIVIELDSTCILLVHLGMTGRLSVVPPKEPIIKHTHLRMALEPDRVELRLVDPRRFGECILTNQVGLIRRLGPDRLGPEPLEIGRGEFIRRLADSQRPIKAFLLDQKRLAGVGNIYADEALYAAQIAPASLAHRIDSVAAGRLWMALRRVLKRSIARQGTTIRDYVTSAGVPGGFQEQLAVYGRAGEQCSRCRHKIILDRTVVTGRSTHWCPGCQSVFG